MPRLRQVPRDEAHEAARTLYRMLFGDRDPVAEPGTATGTRGDWWTVFAGVPDRFVFSQHCKASRDVGLSEEQVEAIPSWPVADCFSPLERAVLAYADCLVLDGGRVPDGVFEALRAGLSDHEILELTYVTCLYEMHATMCRALRLEYDDVEERVSEVPAPEGGNGDVMSVVDGS